MKHLILALAVIAASAGTASAQWDDEKPMTNTGGDVWGEGIATSGSCWARSAGDSAKATTATGHIWIYDLLSPDPPRATRQLRRW